MVNYADLRSFQLQLNKQFINYRLPLRESRGSGPGGWVGLGVGALLVLFGWVACSWEVRGRQVWVVCWVGCGLVAVVCMYIYALQLVLVLWHTRAVCVLCRCACVLSFLLHVRSLPHLGPRFSTRRLESVVETTCIWMWLLPVVMRAALHWWGSMSDKQQHWHPSHVITHTHTLTHTPIPWSATHTHIRAVFACVALFKSRVSELECVCV